jgi:rSAM-associated Gly-rich repeat protein
MELRLKLRLLLQCRSTSHSRGAGHRETLGEERMARDRGSLRALAALLPAGVLGLSISLASADAQAKTAPDSDDAAADRSDLVALRLQAIRLSVSETLSQATEDRENFSTGPGTQLAWWGNGGWRNGGWRNGGWGNGGWHNGGWGNGWHNGWGNGSLLNQLFNPWGNGWHNGWRNW